MRKAIVPIVSLAIAAMFAANPAGAAESGFINGDFETCDLTGWRFASSENGWISEVYPVGALFGAGACSFVAVDQAVIMQDFPSAPGASYGLSFKAAPIPLVVDIGSMNVIDSRCEAPGAPNTADDIAGIVVLEYVRWTASTEWNPGNATKTLLGGAVVPVPLSGGAFAVTSSAAPAGTTHARVKVAACAALGGLVFDDIVVS